MKLKSLLLCADEKIVRVLRRTLGDLEIAVEHCTSAEVALRHLTRDRFEAIIVDCADEGASSVLRSARLAPCNKRAVAVAILNPEMGLRSAFDTGAHFTLYKPISAERAKSSFRAARALMKKERRRNSRIPVTIPIAMSSRATGARLKVTTTDLGEGGVAVNLPRRGKLQGNWELTFTLPGSENPIEVAAEFAWEGTGTQVGLRFVGAAPKVVQQLRDWLSRSSAEFENDDPPVRCKLTDLTLGGCYLEVSSPFPVSTRLTLSMRVSDFAMRIEGVVRVMHADKGMGVEFAENTPESRAQVEKFLSLLSENREILPTVLVEPEGLETGEPAPSHRPAPSEEDALVALFRSKASLPTDLFLAELRKHRGAAGAAASVSA
jgi:c-di-GMP-binding flagellar brake protein YcgR